MNRHRLFASLAVAATATALAAVTAATARPHRASQAAVSQNWAGYVAGDCVRHAVLERVRQLGPADGQVRLGPDVLRVLGGAGRLERPVVGRSSRPAPRPTAAADGSAEYYAWYELVPAAPVKLDLAIKPGDHISAKVDVSGTNVTVSLTDQTSGQSTTKTLQMDNPDTSSAEWIAEAPSACDGSGGCQPLPLADFGTVQFTSATATANGHTGTISDSDWSAQPVALGGSGVSDVSYGYADAESSAGARRARRRCPPTARRSRSPISRAPGQGSGTVERPAARATMATATAAMATAATRAPTAVMATAAIRATVRPWVWLRRPRRLWPGMAMAVGGYGYDRAF